MIDYEKLIAKQQLEIENLKDKNKYYLNIFSDIYLSLYCIGAPLNDNKLEFNSFQREYLKHRIANIIPEDEFIDD